MLRRDAYVSCEGYVGILQRAWTVLSANQGGTADDFLQAPVLDDTSSRVGAFVFSFGRRQRELGRRNKDDQTNTGGSEASWSRV